VCSKLSGALSTAVHSLSFVLMKICPFIVEN
jgi:hypothetical protein